jgi:2-oxoglutarate ferredoxin oxidoreductase subunit alpha
VCPTLKWDDAYLPNRGPVLGAADLSAMSKFHRYWPENLDAVAARTLPGVHEKGAFFTRGSGHNKYGGYTEIPTEYQEVMERLAQKHSRAARAVPEPIIATQPGASIGIVTVGGCDAAVREAIAALAGHGVIADYLRIRAFPFDEQVEQFLSSHPINFIVEQNRDAQLKTLLVAETTVDKDRLESILVYGGFPLSSQHVVEAVLEELRPRRDAEHQLSHLNMQRGVSSAVD